MLVSRHYTKNSRNQTTQSSAMQPNSSRYSIKHQESHCSVSIQCPNTKLMQLFETIRDTDGIMGYTMFRNMASSRLGRPLSTEERFALVNFLDDTLKGQQDTQGSSPPITIARHTLSISPANTSQLGTRRRSASNVRRITEDSLQKHVCKSPMRRVSTGCLKSLLSSPPVVVAAAKPAVPVLDELRACQNCNSKFFANSCNTDTSGFFCCGDCMWSSVLNDSDSPSQSP